jgi:hypothetical protein
MLQFRSPSEFIHPTLDDGSIITFNIYPESIYYIIENVFHKSLYKHEDSNIIGIVDPDIHAGSYTACGRLYKDNDLITLRPISSRKQQMVTSHQVELFNQFLQRFKMIDSLLYIKGIMDNDFDKLPKYNSKLLLKVPLPFDNGIPIDTHTCDPMIKRFVREGLKYR